MLYPGSAAVLGNTCATPKAPLLDSRVLPWVSNCLPLLSARIKLSNTSSVWFCCGCSSCSAFSNSASGCKERNCCALAASGNSYVFPLVCNTEYAIQKPFYEPWFILAASASGSRAVVVFLIFRARSSSFLTCCSAYAYCSAKVFFCANSGS